MDSRRSRSGGGDAVMARGLRRVLQAVRILKRADPSQRPALPAPSARGGLHRLPPVTGHGSGGEGPLHAAIKALIKERPLEAIGERLTYLDEDLSEHDPTPLGDEIRFITNDRVDLLMRDEQGRLVVIEVEPDIGPSDHIGFHQAAKYWVLVAVANSLELREVRKMVAARTIDPALASAYAERYGIEAATVPVVEGPDGWRLRSPASAASRTAQTVDRSAGRSTGEPASSAGASVAATKSSHLTKRDASSAPAPSTTDLELAARVDRLMRAYEITHGRFTGPRHADAVRTALAAIAQHDDSVVLEAIARTSRPGSLRETAEAILRRRSTSKAPSIVKRVAAGKVSPTKSKRTSKAASTKRGSPRPRCSHR